MKSTHQPPTGGRGAFRLADISYHLEVEFDETDPRGNVCGCEEPDCTAEADVLERLKREDVWAWACVQVVASIDAGLEHDDKRFTGSSCWTGGCTYENERDFTKNSGIYEELCDEALEDLLEQLKKTGEQGDAATRALRDLESAIEMQNKMRYPDVSKIDEK